MKTWNSNNQGRCITMKKEIFQDYLQESLNKFKDNIAIEYGPLFLSYNQLDRQSNAIANWIKEQGIPPRTFIGILTENRAHVIISAIGILKAGCIIVPIYTGYPDKRLETMINTTHLKYLFVDTYNHNRFHQEGIAPTSIPQFFFLEQIRIPSEKEEQWSSNPPVVDIDPEDGLYIHFTSGTTGVPKAIVGKNKSLLHYIKWELDTFNIDSHFRTLQLSIPGFDPYLRDIFAPLFAGAAVCIPTEKDVVLNALLFKDSLNRNHIVLMHCVASVFRLLNSTTLNSHDFPSLRFVLLLGEKINPSDLVYWYQIFDERVQLVNFYGPTETTQSKIHYFIQKADIHRERIPIGKPMRGSRVIIMDDKMNACDELEVGEIVIRTPYRSNGYYNDPEMNSKKFIPNPFNNDPNDIVYRSGDMGRLLPDGNIDIIGRIDRQVKIRGYRLELDEIENALTRHPQVREAVVIKKEFSNHNEMLYGFITAENFTETIQKELPLQLKEYLSEKLPDYMVPPVIIVLTEIPIRSNGKVDYAALEQLAGTEQEIIPPATTIEKRLFTIWSEILGTTQFGITNDFFQLGGNSLNMMALTTKIHKEFSIKILLTQVLESPTIEKQAKILEESVQTPFTPIQPADIKEFYPLSSAQDRLYILQQLDPAQTGYNMYQVIPLPPSISKEKIESIFNQLIKRHESFRTSFSLVNGQPVQKIHTDVPFQIEVFDSTLTTPQIIESFVRPFDLSSAPLLRVGFIHTPEYDLLLTDVHHIISDGLSLDILREEFVALYKEQPLPPLPIQYKDFAQWKNSPGEKANTAKQEEFWLREFSGPLPVLTHIPTDFERPPVHSFEGSRISFSLENEELSFLEQLGKDERATLFMVFLALYSVFISKISNQDDVIVGTAVAGRNHSDLTRIIGMFVNTLPLRNFPKPEKSFTQFLVDVRKRSLEVFENQDYPFEQLVEKVAVRDMSRNPIFDFMFVFNSVLTQPRTTSDHLFSSSQPDSQESIPLHEQTSSKFDLSLNILEHPRGYSFAFQYRTKLFKPETIRRFIDYFKNLVRSIMKDPRQDIALLDMLPEEEKETILFRLNSTETAFPQDKTIHRLFEEQVLKTPNSVALVNRVVSTDASLPATGNESEVTYEQLDRKVNHYAQKLVGMGVQPHDIVGIIANRSIEVIAAIFAILKTGATYLPIDPQYPPDRIRYITRDSNAKVIIDHSFIEDQSANPVIPLGEAQSTDNIQKFSSYQPVPGSDPLGAYIIYTSGTTGRPKGALIEHTGLVNYITFAAENYVKGESVNFPLYTSLSFDLTVTSIFTPLVTGNSLIIYSGDDKEMFIRQIVCDSSIGVVKLTPSHMKLIRDIKPLDGVSSLKRLIVGGEELETSLAREIYENFNGKIEIYNEYGPTETVVGCMIYRFDPEQDKARTVSIGKPASNMQIYILDKFMQPLAYGVPGEMVIGGAGVCRGYINNPEMTSNKFITKRFGKKEGRLYKTGDLARWTLDGNVEFLGRIDKQVKIRGYRIELMEIENRLISHDSVKEALVLDRTDPRGDKYLCAYIVSKTQTDSSITTSELRKYLSVHLPDYMIPTHFITIPHIPLNVHGKVDVRALEASGTTIDSGIKYVAPAGREEEIIAGIWKEVLNKDKIGADDNFFEIGGNSLKILMVNSKLKEAFEKDIPIVALFRYTTIGTLAKYIAEQDKELNLIDDNRAQAIEKGKRDRMQQLKKRKGARI